MGNQTASGDAIEHVGDGATVTADATRDGFFVGDDGPGVPSADRLKLLESGFTTADDGIGFGPATVCTITDAHGRPVGYEDVADAGARFMTRGIERTRDSAQGSGPALLDGA